MICYKNDLFEISLNDCPDKRNLFTNDMPNKTVLYSFFSGSIPGRIFVNDIDNPEYYLIVTNFLNWTFIGGNPDIEWLNSAIEFLRKDQYLQIVWPKQDNNDILPDKITEIIPRYEFSNQELQYDQNRIEGILEQGFEFNRINNSIIESCEWKNLHVTAYGSVENFLKNGLGICLMKDGGIYCESYATFNANNCFELGVITPEKHQGNGYAYLTCSYLIDELLKQGERTTWSCNRSNTPSVQVAKRLGYKKVNEYNFLYVEQR